MQLKIERLGLIGSVLCFAGPIWYLFPLYPLTSFLLFASAVEFLLSLGLWILHEREQIGTGQKDLAEFLIRILGLPLTIVAFSSGASLVNLAILRTFFSTVSVGILGTKRLIVFYVLMAAGHLAFLFFRDSPFNLAAVFQVYPAWVVSLCAAFGVQRWISSHKLKSRGQILLERSKRDLSVSRNAALNILGFSFKREEGNLFLRGGLVPSTTFDGVLSSFYLEGMEIQVFGPTFDREWEQFAGRLTKLFSAGLQWQWDGSVLRLFATNQTPGNLARIVSSSFDALAFARKTEAHNQQANRPWPRIQCLVSTGRISQISTGPGVPVRLLVGPSVFGQNEFWHSLSKGRNHEIVSGSKFPVFSPELADFCSDIFLRETMRPIESWTLPGEWRREILERGQAELSERILHHIAKPNHG
ncbi:MAG: hypothetical protein JNM27_22215 [Leptospirales bacterium]|nr:hypothetical protein [Leptospirales bacterium]